MKVWSVFLASTLKMNWDKKFSFDYVENSFVLNKGLLLVLLLCM